MRTLRGGFLDYPEFVWRRSYVLSCPETLKRYKLLSFRLAKILCGYNLLFSDKIYQECFYSALGSPCQKMKFGCVIIHKGQIVYGGSNNTIGPLKFICEQTCVRLSIQSRTESMLGACVHAEELDLWELLNGGTPPLHKCELLVAGLNANCLPSFKQTADFTCLRCAVQMYLAKISFIHIPVADHWERLSPKTALETAYYYAIVKKSKW